MPEITGRMILQLHPEGFLPALLLTQADGLFQSGFTRNYNAPK
jgi:hypothetical protein